MNLSLILAMDNNKLIGSDNKLPWHLPEDLKHFKKITTNKIILMGRKTYDSIGKPLPYRTNIVITRDLNFKPEGVIVYNSIDDLIDYLESEKEEVILIGGSEIIKLLYSYINKLYITHIKHDFEGDCFVKFIDFDKIKLIDKINNYPDDKNKYFYSFCIYEKSNK